MGYKRTMVISLFVMVGGALLFIPAANMVSFPMTLFAIFVLAVGRVRAADFGESVRVDPGPEHSAPARLTLAQAVQLDRLAAGSVGRGHLYSDESQQLSLSSAATAHMLQGPYIAIAAALLVLGFTVMMLHLPAITDVCTSPTGRWLARTATQHLELPAHGTRHGGHLLLRRAGDRGGVDHDSVLPCGGNDQG